MERGMDRSVAPHTEMDLGLEAFKVLYKDIAVRAEKKTHTIKFNVLNLAKTTSLYQVGMRPCIWSRPRFSLKWSIKA